MININLTEAEQPEVSLRQWTLAMSLIHGDKLFPTSGDSWATVEPNTIVDNAYKIYELVKERWGEKFIDPSTINPLPNFEGMSRDEKIEALASEFIHPDYHTKP